MKRFALYIIVIFISLNSLQAQELNARLTINTQKVQSVNKDLISSLESSLSQLLNERKWTDLTYNKNERIDCTITIALNEATTGNNFTADIVISTRRPVYNSTYVTTLMNYRDTQFEFSYQQGQSLEFNSVNIDNNLVAVIAFYAYVIIGLDSDSFSLNGGKPYFAKAMEIANMAQSLGSKGWEPFSGKNNNRYDLAMALTEESSKDFHSMWYTYHRMGLDEMTANASRGRIRIMESMNEIQKLRASRPSSILLTVIAESKIDEIVRICSQSTEEEKQNMKKLLSQLFPTKSNQINQLR
ncbi:MAG: DUF4835 family protein [Dysgonomonas sp.]